MLWVRVPSPTPDKTGDRGCPDSLFSFHIGASPSGKARDFDSLIRWFESSRPSQRFWCRPSAFDIWFDPIAQLAEQLPFKQWVRGSNPRRVTKKKDTTFVVSFFSGGGGGSRTPVRKRFLGNLSGRRRSFTFPYPGVGRQTTGLGSFIVHGALKALRTHVHH